MNDYDLDEQIEICLGKYGKPLFGAVSEILIESIMGIIGKRVIGSKESIEAVIDTTLEEIFIKLLQNLSIHRFATMTPKIIAETGRRFGWHLPGLGAWTWIDRIIEVHPLLPDFTRTEWERINEDIMISTTLKKFGYPLRPDKLDWIVTPILFYLKAKEDIPRCLMSSGRFIKKMSPLFHYTPTPADFDLLGAWLYYYLNWANTDNVVGSRTNERVEGRLFNKRDLYEKVDRFDYVFDNADNLKMIFEKDTELVPLKFYKTILSTFYYDEIRAVEMVAASDYGGDESVSSHVSEWIRSLDITGEILFEL